MTHPHSPRKAESVTGRTDLIQSLGVAPHAAPAWEALTHALDGTDEPVVCSIDPDAWTDTNPAVRAQAAADCDRCPVLDACREYGAHESHGVWGGIDRTPTNARRAMQLEAS